VIFMSEKWYTHALMVNRDPNWYGAIDDTSKETCISSLNNYFSFYDGAITDICLGLLEQSTINPTEAFYWRGLKYLQKKENGIDVDYSGNKGLRALYRCYAEYGVDGVQIFIDKMREKGIRPWLALRMNDAHFPDEQTCFLRSDMYYEEKAAGHKIGDAYGYFGHCYNFKYERYPNAILGYIGELLDKYDFFGLELDFMRNPRCFDYMNEPDCHKIMTEYIRKIKARVLEGEKRVGHGIKISIRTNRSPEHAMAFGFDIKTLCDEGLVDAVIPTPGWNPTDSAVPIAQWRELLGDKVAIIAGIETNNYGATLNTPEQTKAYTAAFYAEGADGIYYNNHEYDTERNHGSWAVSYENCLEGHREFTVNLQDCVANTTLERYKPLPIEFEEKGELPLRVGRIKASDKVKVALNFIGDEYPTLTVGNIKYITAQRVEPIIRKLRAGGDYVTTPDIPLTYDISGFATESPLTLEFKGKGKITYITILIDAE